MKIKEEALEDIVERARSGCRDAFDALIMRFEAKVLKTALYLTHNMDDAQDIAQEVYVKIFCSIKNCRNIKQIEHWIYRITINTTMDFQRRKRFFLPLSKIVKGKSYQDPVL